jgi:Tfp pilus assembly protein PilN
MCYSLVVMAKPLPRSLDLLQPSEKPMSSWDRIYYWVFNVGRYIIIAVELVVLVLFVMRFALDRKNRDLDDEITVKMNMLDSQRETEQKLRRVQQTLDNFSEILDDQDLLSGRYQKIMSEIPSSVTWEDLGITQDRMTFDGTSPSYEDMEGFERILRENTDYSRVDLELSKSGDALSSVRYDITLYFETEEQ